MKFSSLIAFLFLSFTAYAAEKKIIVIDPGHGGGDIGTQGALGITENTYTALYAMQVEEELKQDDRYHVIMTHDSQNGFTKKMLNSVDTSFCGYKPIGSNKKLLYRSCVANYEKANVFLSIHFDSPPATYLNIVKKNGKTYSTLKPKFFEENLKTGYVIFIPSNTRTTRTRYDKSLDLAEIISKNMQTELLRTPSDFHQKVDLNVSRGYRLVDEKNGIFLSSGLSVLRNTKMPALLLEVGVIPDLNELKMIDTENFRKQFAKMIHTSLNQFFDFSNR